ncbi:hypothetical protein NDU88_008733 [Pleurodeles waltl]|uniref:NAD(P)(+)--arginine ADP-ribosyltransferase n=2 Tax=Pleurodeles waltl TaxID=8319 RepID=A0AAV7NWX0_PLEWA|nr:hypothetical protein NDU88_008733 [Pleurodeles waltl]
MVDSAYDDQYKGCEKVMEAKIPQLFQLENKSNPDFAFAWSTAKKEWEKKKPGAVKPPGFKDEYAIAILAYTLHGPLFEVFNTAVREAGQSKKSLGNFQFKALHYFLTNAHRVLKEHDNSKCQTVYRGIRKVQFKAVEKQHMRFGQFASSSSNEGTARRYGEDTFFTIKTCYGVSIKDFSFSPGEEEILIPPYEKFKVTSFSKDRDKSIIGLQSMEKVSNYNCAFATAPSTRNLSSSLQTVLFFFWGFAVVVNTFG